MLTICLVENESPELEEVKILFNEYVKELNENLSFQQIDKEFDNPLIKYGPPSGALFIAYLNNEAVGCIALQKIDEHGVCEMKRLYIRPPYRKKKVGQALVQEILEKARSMGYSKMVLDTLLRLQPAINLYKRFGFFDSSAYYANPLEGVVYMEKML